MQESRGARQVCHCCPDSTLRPPTIFQTDWSKYTSRPADNQTSPLLTTAESGELLLHVSARSAAQHCSSHQDQATCSFKSISFINRTRLLSSPATHPSSHLLHLGHTPNYCTAWLQKTFKRKKSNTQQQPATTGDPILPRF